MSVRAVLVVLFLPVMAFAASIENTQHLELSIKDIQSMHIICGPGFLDVFGVEGADRIKVTAAVRISGINRNMLQDFLDKHVLLSLKKRRRKAVLQSEFKNQNLMKADAKIDLTVEVPKNLRVKIDDVTQNVFIKEAGSGSLDIEGVRGKVTTRE